MTQAHTLLVAPGPGISGIRISIAESFAVGIDSNGWQLDVLPIDFASFFVVDEFAQTFLLHLHVVEIPYTYRALRDFFDQRPELDAEFFGGETGESRFTPAPLSLRFAGGIDPPAEAAIPTPATIRTAEKFSMGLTVRQDEPVFEAFAGEAFPIALTLRDDDGVPIDLVGANVQANGSRYRCNVAVSGRRVSLSEFESAHSLRESSVRLTVAVLDAGAGSVMVQIPSDALGGLPETEYEAVRLRALVVFVRAALADGVKTRGMRATIVYRRGFPNA